MEFSLGFMVHKVAVRKVLSPYRQLRLIQQGQTSKYYAPPSLQETSPSQWQEALLSEPGERQFVSGEGDFTRTSSVVITGEDWCADKAGCRCAGHPALRGAVCAHTRNSNADCHDSRQLACVSPVQPVGHCCEICGQYGLN
jgi:hypothetical protein